ncbi:hypothetical protein CC86DRAFT_413228 [Ophiobolus disseminans]|uniref:Uncharacterized protein n=1 Tax=Ophiobolus disseminans TaxID=1469910 RepID=A0A6A6ZFR7_9PLEO|nr:hypothetical protein CC86DRAFT_413228 [Ophiobolus disseminans]
MTTHQPFCFLNLPKELRYICCEKIRPTIHHHIIIAKDADGKFSEVTLVRRCLPVSLLGTSKALHEEAKPFFEAKFREIKNEPMRFIVDKDSANALVANHSPLIACFGLEVNGWRGAVFDNIMWAPIVPANSPGGASPATIPNPVSLYATLAAPLSNNEIMSTDFEAQYDNGRSFIDHCTRILSSTHRAQITKDRRFDIEIRLSDCIEDWHAGAMHDFVMNVHELCNAAGVAVVLLRKSSSDTLLPNRPEPICGGNREWMKVPEHCQLHVLLQDGPACVAVEDHRLYIGDWKRGRGDGTAPRESSENGL